MDLDPGDGVSWDQVISAAEDVRQRLEAFGLSSFVKTSGGKGLHVVAPLPKAEWPAVKAFCKEGCRSPWPPIRAIAMSPFAIPEKLACIG